MKGTRAMNRRRFTVALTVGTVAMLAVGCAQVYPGEAERDRGFDPNVVQPSLLDTGNYATKPRDPLGAAGSFKEGRRAESRRLAENVVLPFQVDPALGNPYPAWVIKDEGSLAFNLDNEAIEAAANDHRFISGFKVSASDSSKDTTKSLSNTVGIFASAAEAAAAAPGIVAAAAPAVSDFSKKTYPTFPTTIPRYPDTRAWVHEEPQTDKAPMQVVQAFTVRGQYLLVQTAKTPSVAASAELIAATLDQQSPLIDTYAPTPYDQLAALPVDPTGLWARLLVAPEDNHVVMMGVYGPHGALAFWDDPVETQRQFTEAGVDLLGYDEAFVLRARDAAAAAKLRDYFADGARKEGYEEVPGISGLPDAICQREPEKTKGSSRKTQCWLVADRYLINLDGRQETSVRQETAAQYLMLTAP